MVNTRTVLNENINRGAPYYPFENINITGDYKYEDGGKVLKMEEQKSGIFVIDSKGAELLLDVAQGWSVDFSVKVQANVGFKGFPTVQNKGTFNPYQEITFTCNGDMRGHLYLSTKDGGKQAIESDQGSYVFGDLKADIRVEILGYRANEVISVNEDPQEYTSERDTEDPVVIADYTEDEEVLIVDDEPVLEEPTTSSGNEGDDDNFLKVFLMGGVLLLLSYTVFLYLRGGSDD